MRDCEAKHDVGMEIKVFWLVQARKIWIAASKFDLFLQTHSINTGYYFVDRLRYAFIILQS